MLHRLGMQKIECAPSVPRESENVYARNEQEDLKKAIDYLYEFKEKLSKLHPVAIEAIDNLLQRPRY